MERAGGSSRNADTRSLYDFHGFMHDAVVSGLIWLPAGVRLREHLDEHEEYWIEEASIRYLADGRVERPGRFQPVRSDLLAVHATGPRGNMERRVMTGRRVVVVTAGPYRVIGVSHEPPSASYGRPRIRRSLFPMTDVEIGYVMAGQPYRRAVASLLVNGRLVDTIMAHTNEKIEGTDETSPTT